MFPSDKICLIFPDPNEFIHEAQIMKFTKMHGCGNDYIYVDCTRNKLANPAELAVRLSDRHFGVGSDGMICIEFSNTADFKMVMFNADGSQGEMCGNGIRCVGKYVYDYGLTKQTEITVETLAGIKALRLNVQNGAVSSVRVCMGQPHFTPAQIPVDLDCDRVLMEPIEIDGKFYEITCVSMGNPHAVIFVDDVDAIDLEKIGPKFENHPLFPERINTEFVQVMDEQRLKMRVWERGSGETLACGTGTCAALAAAVICGKAKPHATVLVRGGALDIEWNLAEDQIYMTGPAAVVFDGELK